VEVRIEGPEEPVASERLACEWTDAIELVRVFELNPVLQAQVPDNALLPLCLIGFDHFGKAICRGHGEFVALATGEARSDSEDSGRVTAAGEADETRGTLQRRPDRRLQSAHRFDLLSRARNMWRPRIEPENESGGNLERREPRAAH
jgi:hypothetical protein